MLKIDPRELEKLKAEIDGLIAEHNDVLGTEPTILRPLDEARKEAQRRWNTVSDHLPSMGKPH